LEWEGGIVEERELDLTAVVNATFDSTTRDSFTAFSEIGPDSITYYKEEFV
jgi:hypothetical protein